MKQLIYPHLGLFLYHLNDGVKEEDQLIPVPKELYNGYPIDGLRYSSSLGDTNSLLALYSVNEGDNNQPQDVSCLAELKNKILKDQVVEEKIKIAADRKVGKSWMILGVIPSFWDSLTADSLALEAAKSLTIGQFTETVKSEKFMGATVYEFWQPPSQSQDVEAENNHVVIILYHDKTALDSFNQFKLDWMKLFLYRHKILWAYRNSQNQDIKQFLRDNLLPNDKTLTSIQVRSEASTMLESGLIQRKKVLQESYETVRQYAEYITFLEVQLQTLETNLYNYQECRNRLLKEAEKFGGITDTNLLKSFTEIPAKKCQMQITRDIAALSPGLKAQEIFINTIRGSAEIEQVESDRNLELEIATIGIGISAASITASLVTPLVEVITLFLTKKIVGDKEIIIAANVGLNLGLALIISAAIGIACGYVGGKLWSRMRSRRK